MPYSPLIRRADQFYFLPNPCARPDPTEDLLQRLYDRDILPSRDECPRSFRPEQVFEGLYISEREREALLAEVEATEIGPCEDRLDNMVWDEARSMVVCVLGPVGWGKSTFIDYYMRCHCLHRGNHHEEFEKKLVIYFDAKAIQDKTGFHHDFFHIAQSSIRFQCDERGFDINSAMRRRPLQPSNIREWVWGALEELTRAARKSEPNSFRYIALVIDNLDQTTEEVQVRAAAEVEQWMKAPTIWLWRVIIPLWPTTYQYLRNSRYNVMQNARVFRLGNIPADRLVGDRQGALRRRMDASSVATDGACSEFFAWLTRRAEPRLVNLMRRLSGGDLRIFLRLWSGLLRSPGAYSLWQRTKDLPEDAPFRHDYELLDAMITGPFPALCHDAGRVVNVFGFGSAAAQPRDLLIGPHILHMLGRNVRGRSALVQDLERLGYDERAVERAELRLIPFNFLHQIPVGAGDVEYEVHDSVVSAYNRYPDASTRAEEMGSLRRHGLMFELAYIDNVAMVTPVDPEALSHMSPTRRNRFGDFQPRVETTLAFLRFLRSCEEQFCTRDMLSPKLDREEFTETLQQVGLPCLWGGMARAYYERIRRLHVLEALAGVEPSWWVEVLDDPLWDEASNAGTTLSPL